jgi:hypothetical protein
MPRRVNHHFAPEVFLTINIEAQADDTTPLFAD